MILWVHHIGFLLQKGRYLRELQLGKPEGTQQHLLEGQRKSHSPFPTLSEGGDVVLLYSKHKTQQKG